MFRVGIDLGGTNIAVGTVSESDRILSKVSVPTLASRPWPAVVADMGDAVEAAAAQAGLSLSDCVQIGIGSPGTCDSRQGTVVRAYNLGWYGVPVCSALQERFQVPAKLSNDANCAALGEVVAGAAKGCRNMVLITLGTGVGSGIIINGKIYAGMRSAGAELGHTLLVLDGEPCTCGRRGCWEAYASATALIRQTRQAQSAHPESLLAQTPPQEVNGRTAFDAARAGDQAALEVFRASPLSVAGLTCGSPAGAEMILWARHRQQGVPSPCCGICGENCFCLRTAPSAILTSHWATTPVIIGAAALSSKGTPAV